MYMTLDSWHVLYSRLKPVESESRERWEVRIKLFYHCEGIYLFGIARI